MEFLEDLRSICEGLYYVSETDAPVLPFLGTTADDVSWENIRQQAGATTEGTINEIPFGAFFERHTKIRDWYGGLEKARAEKYLKLQRLLEVNLRSIKVFRVGSIQIDIYVIGMDKESCLMGVMTKAVET